MIFAQKIIVPCACGSDKRKFKYLDSIRMKCSYLVTDKICRKPKLWGSRGGTRGCKY